MRLFRSRGCLVLLVALTVVAYVIGRFSPSSPRAGQVNNASAPTSQPLIPTLTLTMTSPPPTLDEAGKAILATQAWFVQQQTQAAGGHTVEFVPTKTLPPTVRPTQALTAQNAVGQPQTVAFTPINAQGNTNEVLGSFTFPAGLYRAKVNTTGYFIAELKVTQGDCEGPLFTVLFNLSEGQANGAEAVLDSKGCTTFIEISNVSTGWQLEITQIG